MFLDHRGGPASWWLMVMSHWEETTLAQHLLGHKAVSPVFIQVSSCQVLDLSLILIDKSSLVQIKNVGYSFLVSQ